MIFVLSMFAACNNGKDGEGDATDSSAVSTPVETPAETPEATPESTPLETPEATPESTPLETPEATPESTPLETPEETPSESVPEEIKALLTIDAKYSVIRPENCSDSVKDAAVALKNALETVTGASIFIKEDFLYGNNQPDQYEILVGQTNREESANALATIKYNDYIVTASGDKLVIAAYTDEKLVEALEYVKGLFESSTESVKFMEEDQKTVKAEYKFDQIKFGETDLSGYTIVIPKKATNVVKSYADKFQKAVLEYSGILLPIADDNDEETEKEILIGSTSREASTAIKAAALPANGYAVAQKGSKIVIKGKDDAFVILKVMSDIIADLENGSFAAEEGKVTISKDPVFTTFTFTDVHNNFAMLEPTNSTKDYIVRKNVQGMIDLLLETEGKVDMVMVGGDLMSDYPSWNSSGRWPYGYFVEYRQLLLDTFGQLAKDGKCVTFNGGNHDYGQGEDAVNSIAAKGYATAAPHTPTGNYNSSDFYFGDAGMRQNIGELPESEMFWKVGEHTGDKYLLAYHYEMNGIHIMGLAPDPDHPGVWSKQGQGFNAECLEWLDKKLDEIDPYGTEIIFMNCHYVLDQPYEKNANGEIGIGSSTEIRADLVPIYKGHTNLFHFYGHWETWYHDYSVRGVLHYNNAGSPILMKGRETSSIDVLGDKPRNFTTVNMGHFRAMYNDFPDMFYNDRITGYGGYSKVQIQHGSTCTPKLCQGVYVKVYENRIVFQYKNYGTYAGCTTEDILEPYTVWLYK